MSDLLRSAVLFFAAIGYFGLGGVLLTCGVLTLLKAFRILP